MSSTSKRPSKKTPPPQLGAEAPDILLPSSFENRWKEQIRPVLEALGVETSSSLLSMFSPAQNVKIWPLRVRRPKPGSILRPVRRGKSYRAGDAIVRFSEESQRESKDGLARIDGVYGFSAKGSAAGKDDQERAEWDDHPLLAVSMDFITIVADILPGKEAFVGVEIWANSMLPVSVLAQNPLGFSSEFQIGRIRSLIEGDVELRTVCQKCLGSGSVKCRKCAGDGTWQPEGSCRKCEGAGGWTCSRCDGSGDYIGKYGDRMGDCNKCGGTGRQTCFVCKGSGEPPILSCNTCEGTGACSCYACSGEGMVRVGFNASSGIYYYHDCHLEPEDVHAIDALAGGDYSLDQSATGMLGQLLEEAARFSAKLKQVATTQAEIAKIDQCLDLAMESQGVTSALLDSRPMAVGKGESTVHRSKKRLILQFPMLKPPARARAGDLPFKAETPLRFVSDGQGRNEIELNRVGNDPFKRPVDAAFHSLEIIDGSPHVLISFPADIATDQFPEKTWIKPDIIPPSELAQQKELGRWCKTNEAPELIASFAVAPAAGAAIPPKKIAAVHKSIDDNPRQQEALDWIMSDAPLVLVKGPPGTGKTTVITEAAMQSIARGGRILICSETHQAVANVLERLHKNGGIRMIRHARSDNSKLSDLEKSYLEDGSRQGFLRNVRERTDQKIQTLESAHERLASLEPLLESAQAGATSLQSIRERMAKTEEQSRQNYDQRIEEITKMEKERCQEAEKSGGKEILGLEREHHKLEAALYAASKSQARAESSRDKAQAAFAKKTGRNPERGAAGKPSFLTKILPNFVASEKLLTQRYSSAGDAVAKAKADLKETRNLISENRRNATKRREQMEKAIQKFRAAAAKSRMEAEAQLNARLENLATGLRTAEAQFLPPQAEAAAAWNALGRFGVCNSDDSPTVWGQSQNECQREFVRNGEQLGFCRRWQLASESSNKELTKLFWDTTQVFLSTCVGLASWRSFASHFGKLGVDLVIIDEAAHATLTQTLIPLGKAKRAVLIGDEMQLPPAAPMELADRCDKNCAARCQVAPAQTDPSNPFKPPMASCWLERSAFEWISETRPWVPKIMLNRQFRMHPDIADFVADIFYKGGLENGVTAEDRRLAFGDFTKAVCLVSTSAYKNRFEEKPSAQATSIQNPLEVELTRRILTQARKHLDARTSFGVVTPYEAQKTLMQNELADLLGSDGHLVFDREDIASVDSFQGSERDVMIASFVRSPRQHPQKCKVCDGTGITGASACGSCQGRGSRGPRLDWVHDLRRLNVAFSRARKMLILVGDVEALTDPRFGTEAGTQVLARFREHVANRGRVLHVWEEKENE